MQRGVDEIDAKIKELLNRQQEINNNITLLTKESEKITNELTKLIGRSGKSAAELKVDLVKLVKRKLKARGFETENGIIEGTQIINVNKGNSNIVLNIRASKFFSGEYNAWYTIDRLSSEKIDFQILGYVDIEGVVNYVVLPRATVLEIINKIKQTPKGQYHLFLRGNDREVCETKSLMNLSEYINKDDLIR